MVLLLMAALATSSAQSKLDLTASSEQYENEGFRFQRLLFREGQQKVSMELPNGWTFRSAPTRLQLVPGALRFAEIVIDAVPLPEPRPFDEAAHEALEKSTVQGLPPGSQAPEIKERLSNSILINGHESIGTVVAYQNLGEKFRRLAVVVNFPDLQLVCRMTALDADFDKLHTSLRRMLLSWQRTDAAAAANK